MSRVSPQSDLSGRLLALLVFLTGIGILVFVFVTALHLFQSPVPGLALPVAAGTTAPPAANIGAALAQFVRDLLLLGVMTLVGSLLASKGAHLYFGTVYPVHETPAVPTVKNGRGTKPTTAVEEAKTGEPPGQSEISD